MSSFYSKFYKKKINPNEILISNGLNNFMDGLLFNFLQNPNDVILFLSPVDEMMKKKVDYFDKKVKLYTLKHLIPLRKFI